MARNSGWVGVDLDATLAQYTKWVASDEIGEPIMPMVDRVKAWLAEGTTVKIFTARGSAGEEDKNLAYPAIRAWSAKHLGIELEITNVKDLHMIALYDDRAVQVERNTGKLIEDELTDLKKAYGDLLLEVDALKIKLGISKEV